MSTESQREAVDLLQQLGLKEYEAESFVVLARMEKATAKEISEHSEVPRTRVYDAIRVLESRGLVEVQHTSPQQFRAVSIDEAVDIIDRQYDSRLSTLRDALATVDPIDVDGRQVPHEVWSLVDEDAVAARTRSLVEAADEEVVLVVGSEQFFTEELADVLQSKLEADVDVILGAITAEAGERIQDRLPDAEVFVSGLDWLRGEGTAEDLAIGRMLLVDHQAILVSTFHTDGEQVDEQAVFGQGFTNGLVVIARRLMAIGRFGRGDFGEVRATASEEEGA